MMMTIFILLIIGSLLGALCKTWITIKEEELEERSEDKE